MGQHIYCMQIDGTKHVGNLRSFGLEHVGLMWIGSKYHTLRSRVSMKWVPCLAGPVSSQMFGQHDIYGLMEYNGRYIYIYICRYLKTYNQATYSTMIWVCLKTWDRYLNMAISIGKMSIHLEFGVAYFQTNLPKFSTVGECDPRDCGTHRKRVSTKRDDQQGCQVMIHVPFKHHPLCHWKSLVKTHIQRLR